jgi:hypothetical protein
MKRTAEFSKIEMQAWYAVLAGFPIEVINAAIIEVSLKEMRFPEVGDIYQICRRSLPKLYAPLGGSTKKEEERLGKQEIRDVASRLGLKVT